MNNIGTHDWTAPLPGYWRRDFRLAEWLPGPVSHSCETWLLPALDRGFSEASMDEYHMGTTTGFIVVNGWCFTTDPRPTNALNGLLRAPLRMVRIGLAMARMFARPDVLERRVATPGLERYRSIDFPALQSKIAELQRRVSTASPAELVAGIDEVAVHTGRLMIGMVQAMGFAGKVEFALAQFFAERLAGRVDGTALDLSIGLSPARSTPEHAVVTLDWCEPTAGERATHTTPAAQIHADMVATRTNIEAQCRAVLAGDDKALARFQLLVDLLARWVPVRESMAAEFTTAWPVIRQAFARLGNTFVEHGVLADAADIFELSRAEIDAAAADDRTPLHNIVGQRRTMRSARRLLNPPAHLGTPKGPWKRLDSYLAVLRTPAPGGAEVIVSGVGSSPGAVSGIARIVTGPDEFDELQPGEILVAPGTAPAWTPLLAIAAGVVTDGGGPFAHTSVVAREFGIPAIVGATGATALIRTGDHITIDAASGSVTRAA